MKKISSRSKSKTGYICKKEGINKTWRESGLESSIYQFGLAMDKQTAKNYCSDGYRKVKVTLTMTVEELE